MTESTEESTSMSPKEVVPPESGVSVADHGGDPGVFLAEVNKGLEQVVDAINRLLDVAVNWLNDHIDEIGTIGGGIAGTIVAGPVGGIVGAISGNHAAAAAQDRLAATFDKINRTWQEQVLPALRKAIGSMLGDPLKMAEIGQAYRNAVKVLGDATDTMSDSKIYESEFDGNAARAYDKVREEQVNAYAGVQTVLSAAATQMDAAEKTLINYWTQQLVNIGNLIENIGEVTSDATDVGKIALGDAGPVVHLLTVLMKGGDDILAAWVDNVTHHATEGAGFWEGQISGLGNNGLFDGQWPRISERDTPNLNSEKWTN